MKSAFHPLRRFLKVAALAAAFFVLPSLLAGTDCFAQQEVAPEFESSPTSVAGQFYKRYFMADPSCMMLMPEESAKAALTELEMRRERLQAVGVSSPDYTGMQYALVSGEGERAVVQGSGVVQLRTSRGTMNKTVERVFDMVHTSQGWKVADTRKGVWEAETAADRADRVIDRIEGEIEKERRGRYESLANEMKGTGSGKLEVGF